MENKSIVSKVLEELSNTAMNIDESQIQELKANIYTAHRIFVAGAGRSLLMAKAFAMRLMHAGYTSYVVGETITPAIEQNDLLIVVSGSGNTSTLISIANKCKQIGATLSLITTNPDSNIGKLANTIIYIPISTSKSKTNIKTIQPGGNTFEQLVLLLCDSIIIDIMNNIKVDNTILMKRHANLE